MMMWMFPPAPTPFPLPSKPRTFGARPCQGWARVGGEGEFQGTDFPTLPPFPRHYFFGVVPREGGIEGCPTMPRSSPPPPPPLHPRFQPLLARLGFLEWRGGGGAGTRCQRPPFHPTYASNPHNAPAPTRTTSGTLSQ